MKILKRITSKLKRNVFYAKPIFVYPNIDGINDGNIRTIEQLKNALLYLSIEQEILEDIIIEDINDL